MTLNSGSVNGWGNLISVPMSTDPSWHSVDTWIYETLTLVLLNKLRCRTHFYFSANQITWSRLLIQIHILNGKQSRSRCWLLHGFRRSGEGIWLSTSEGHLVGAEKTVWRSGLWDWSRGCMQMRGAVSMLVRGTVKSLKWRLVFTSTQPTALHHCAWSLITRVPLWGPLGRPLCWWPCYHRWIAWGMCQEALDMERCNGEERTESKCRKDKDYDLQYGTGPPAEFRWVSMLRLSHWSGQQQHLLQWLQALGAQEMQWAQVLEKRPWLQMYTVPGNCTPLGWQTTEGSPDRTWQAWGGSFLLLLRRHALSSRWLWTFNHNTCENRLEEVQGSSTSSLFMPPLFQNTWPCACVRSAMLHARETWPLTKLNLQRLQQNDRAMIRQICNVRPQDIVTTRSNELLVQLGIENLDLILKERRLWWYGHVKHSNGAVKTAFNIQVDGKHGPGRPKMTWKQQTERDCREWKLSAINPYDRHTWRSGARSSMHAASQLSGRGPTGVDIASVPAR